MLANKAYFDAGKEAVLAEYPMGKRMVPGPEARSGRRDLTGLMQPCGDPYAEHRALDDAWLHSTWTEGEQILDLMTPCMKEGHPCTICAQQKNLNSIVPTGHACFS